MTKKTIKGQISIPMENIFDDIAERLKHDDALDMDFDAISEKLTEQFGAYSFKFDVSVTINTKTKEILAISEGMIL